MQDAVDFVASQAKLPAGYEVRVVPEPKNLIEKILASTSEDPNDSKRIGLSARQSLADLAMPYLQNLDPARVRSIREALNRLEMLRDEGVVMMMPFVMK